MRFSLLVKSRRKHCKFSCCGFDLFRVINLKYVFQISGSFYLNSRVRFKVLRHVLCNFPLFAYDVLFVFIFKHILDVSGCHSQDLLDEFLVL
jgi:hypothetical protein